LSYDLKVFLGCLKDNKETLKLLEELEKRNKINIIEKIPVFFFKNLEQIMNLIDRYDINLVKDIPFKCLNHDSKIENIDVLLKRVNGDPKRLDEFPQELKFCIYELIDIISNEDNSNILSESVGSYNVTRMTKQDIEKNKSNIIKKYLADVKVNDVYVLYCGEDIDD